MIIFIILMVLTAVIPLLSLIKDDNSSENSGALGVFSSSSQVI